MTALFRNKVIPFLWEWEGTKYENDPDDPGNTGSKFRGTKYGIDARSHPNVDIKNLTDEKATEIYWNEWLRNGCDHLPSPLDWLYFDAAVNCGTGRAQEFLKASGTNPKIYQDARRSFYNRLAEQKPKLKKFLKGWLARVDDLSRVAKV